MSGGSASSDSDDGESRRKVLVIEKEGKAQALFVRASSVFLCDAWDFG